MKNNLFEKSKDKLEQILPMRLGSLALFAFILYMFFIVGRSVWANYNSNKSIEIEAQKVVALEEQIQYLKDQISYFETYSFKEKEARAKLGYRAPGESVLSLPIDKEEDKFADSGLTEAALRVPNYKMWKKYFFNN
ncbi:MAG: septum formation initiator family protein [bacterium]